MSEFEIDGVYTLTQTFQIKKYSIDLLLQTSFYIHP